MAASGFGDLSRRLDMVAVEMSGKGLERRLRRVGMESKRDIDAAVTGTLGDQSMSGWRRSSPIQITGMFDVNGSAVEMSPVPRARGPMRVLESGRNQGNAGGMAGPGVSSDGTTRRTKSGAVRKVRARQARRWNGRTDGKQTWTHATETMVAKMPERYERQLVADMGKFLKG